MSREEGGALRRRICFGGLGVRAKMEILWGGTKKGKDPKKTKGSQTVENLRRKKSQSEKLCAFGMAQVKPAINLNGRKKGEIQSKGKRKSVFLRKKRGVLFRSVVHSFSRGLGPGHGLVNEEIGKEKKTSGFPGKKALPPIIR